MNAFSPDQFLAAIALVCQAFLPVPADDTGEVIKGVCARSRGVVSGRITYNYRTFRKRALSSWTNEERLSFSGDSWAQRAKGLPTVTINHDGYRLNYSEAPQPTGRIDRGVTMRPPEILESREYLSRSPTFAGSFWFPNQRDWVKKHAADFRVVGTGNVDGMDVTICEADVSVKESTRGAFKIYHPSLQKGGKLRLAVAPQMGFVLPAIESVDPDGRVVTRFGAARFAEKAPGVYFPDKIFWEFASVDEPEITADSDHGEFDISSELINQPIPEEDFRTRIPVGTQVEDTRDPKRVAHFTIRTETPSAKLVELRESEKPTIEPPATRSP